MKVKVKRYGTIHYVADCQDCEWDCGIRGKKAYSSQDVRNKVYAHVKKTGHTVQVEGGTSTDYYLEK